MKKGEDLFYTRENSEGNWEVKNSKNESLSSHSDKLTAWKETRRLARGSGCAAQLQDEKGQISTSNDYEIS